MDQMIINNSIILTLLLMDEDNEDRVSYLAPVACHTALANTANTFRNEL